jgi:hypothetical protein
MSLKRAVIQERFPAGNSYVVSSYIAEESFMKHFIDRNRNILMSTYNGVYLESTCPASSSFLAYLDNVRGLRETISVINMKLKYYISL